MTVANIEPRAWVALWWLVGFACLVSGHIVVTTHNPLTWLVAWAFSTSASHLMGNLIAGTVASLFAGDGQLWCFLAGCIASSAVQMNACGASGGVFGLLVLASWRLWRREWSWGAASALATSAMLLSNPIAAHVMGCLVGVLCATLTSDDRREDHREEPEF